MSIYNFSKRKLQITPADSFEKGKAFQIGHVDKSGKNVKTQDGWKPIKTHSHLADKKYSAGSIDGSHTGIGVSTGKSSALTAKNETITADIVKIGKSGKLPSDGDLKMLASKHGMRFDNFKEACETSIRAYENEKDEQETESAKRRRLTERK